MNNILPKHYPRNILLLFCIISSIEISCVKCLCLYSYMFNMILDGVNLISGKVFFVATFYNHTDLSLNREVSLAPSGDNDDVNARKMQ